jgi:hypothetical protein
VEPSGPRSLHAIRPGLVGPLAFAATALPVLVAVMLVLSSPLVVDRRYASDTFVILDGAWRLVSGQRQHVDFHCPYGVLHTLMFAAGLRALGTGMRFVPVAICAWSLLAFGWAYGIGAARLPRWINGAFALLVAATTLGQNLLGAGCQDLSHSAYYNRTGFALVLIALIAVLPPRSAPGTRALRAQLVAGGLSVGVALSLAAFTKVTYALVIVAGLGLVAWMRRYGREFWAAVAAGALVATLALAPFVGWRLDRVVADYAVAATARAQMHDAAWDLPAALLTMPGRSNIAVTWGRVLEIVRNDYLDMLGLGLITAFAGGIGLLRTRARRAAFVAAAFASSLAIVLGNWQWGSSPLLPGLALVLVAIEVRTAPATWLRWLGLGMTVPHIAAAAASVVLVGAPDDVVGGSTLSTYQTPPLRMLLSEGRDTPCDPAEYAARIDEVAAFLDGLQRPDLRVANFDFANPYPFATQTTPPRGVAVVQQLGATFLQQDIQFAGAVGDATVVVIPHCPFSVDTASALVAALRPQLEASFERRSLRSAEVYVKREP